MQLQSRSGRTRRLYERLGSYAQSFGDVDANAMSDRRIDLVMMLMMAGNEVEMSLARCHKVKWSKIPLLFWWTRN